MSIDLTGLPIASATPSLAQFGGILTPALGGPTQRIDRAGTRWSWQFQTAPMAVEPDGRRWAAILTQAAREGALIPIKQVNFDVGAPGSPTVAADTASGRSIPIAGLTPGYAIRAGQWLSIVHDDQRYLDMVTAQSIAASDGTAMVTLQNLLRASIGADDVVELARPMIEGWITGDWSWALAGNRTTSFSLTVAEAA